MKDAFKFIGKIGAVSIAFSCMFFGGIAFAQEATTSGKIQIEETKTPVVKAESSSPSPVYSGSEAPYTLSNGRRDPFVPFGGNAAPEPIVEGEGIVAPQASALPKEGKTSDGKELKTLAELNTLPVVVTGTIVSGKANFAILAPEGGDKKSNASFVVTSGDTVGEYTVDRVYPDRVVLLWKGKAFTIPVKQYTGKSKDGKAAVAGDAPVTPSLPVPEVKEEEKKAADEVKDAAADEDSGVKDVEKQEAEKSAEASKNVAEKAN